MEENKTKKIRVSTIIFLIIILILIGGIVYFVLQNKELKSKQLQSEAEMQSLQNKAEQLENTINEVRNITSYDLLNELESNNTTKDSTSSENITSTESVENIYPNSTGYFTMKNSYINITVQYINNESEIIVDVGENKFNDSVGKVSLGIDLSNGVDKNSKYKNLDEKIMDVLVDYNTEGGISSITLLTASGKAYTTPWAYRYTDKQSRLFEMGSNILKLGYDDKGGCGYDKNGKVVFHTEDIYVDGE